MTTSMIDGASARRETLRIPIGVTILFGDVTLPPRPRALVILASADGDRIFARGNEVIATRLVEAGFATLVVNLLTPSELREDAETAELRFDQSLVASRVMRVVRWVHAQEQFSKLEIGCFAGGLCAGSVLASAAVRPIIKSVVCRGARFELAGALLDRVSAPVLLLAGERDTAHLAANRQALLRLPRTSHLRILTGSRHLLDDPADLERVSRAAVDWFTRTLALAAEDGVEDPRLARV